MAKRQLPLATIPLLLAGCYSVGFQPVAGLRELAVPVFENLTLRRGIEHDLTRLVRQEVLESTSLHLAREGSARAVLRGAVTGVSEAVMVSGPAEEVLASSVTVATAFGVYEGGRLIVGDDTDGDGAPDTRILLQGFAEFNTARGESRQTATDEALRDLAEMIAYRLQDPWDDRFEPNDDAAGASLIQPGRHVGLRHRGPDWFAVSLPARSWLRVRLERGPGLTLLPHDAAGGPLADAERKDADRVVELLSEGPRSALIEVVGDGSGSRYELLVETHPDDGAEPDSTPAEANQLPGGRRAWRVRGLQRDDDHLAVALPQGLGLRAALLEAPEQLRVVICDDLGAPRQDARHAGDGHAATLPPRARSARVLLRVEGDDAGRLYTLEVTLTD